MQAQNIDAFKKLIQSKRDCIQDEALALAISASFIGFISVTQLASVPQSFKEHARHKTWGIQKIHFQY
jgi:hypothetical protein